MLNQHFLANLQGCCRNTEQGMATKLGGIHSEDTSSFFMESRSQQGTPSLCTGTNMLLESLGRGRGRLGMLQTLHISTQPDTKDSSAHLQLMGLLPLQPNKASGYTVVLSLGKVCTLTLIHKLTRSNSLIFSFICEEFQDKTNESSL